MLPLSVFLWSGFQYIEWKNNGKCNAYKKMNDSIFLHWSVKKDCDTLSIHFNWNLLQHQGTDPFLYMIIMDSIFMFSTSLFCIKMCGCFLPSFLIIHVSYFLLTNVTFGCEFRTNTASQIFLDILEADRIKGLRSSSS